MCPECLKTRVDITVGIPRQLAICFCRDCGRYQVPPSGWVAAELGSADLLGLCLKRIPQLSKVNLINARWIWTEEHSRRLKLELTVRKEIFEGAILEDTFEVMFVVGTQQCEDCRRSYTDHTWTACVQVRQHHVQHKRAMFYLEQLVLKRQAAGLFHATGVSECSDGIDFFFGNRSHAQAFCLFVQSTLASRSRKSDKLVGADLANNVYNKKYVFMIDILPAWKGDCVVLPKRLATSRQIPRVQVVQRLGDGLRLIDPLTAERATISLKEFNQNPFMPALSPKSLVRFTVLDLEVEDKGPRAGSRAQLATATVCLTAELESGTPDMRTWDIHTHLGGLLDVGDEAEGYFMPIHATAVAVNQKINADDLPPVLLVRKFHASRSHGKKRRFFLKKFSDIEAGGIEFNSNAVGAEARAAEDFEEFMNDLEDVPEMRREVAMYAAPGAETLPDYDEATGPQVAMEELLREMAAL